MTTRPALVATLLLGALVAGCGPSGGTSRTKAGSEVAAKPQILHIESTNAGSPEARYFAARIEARSGGALKALIRQSYPASLPANEARLARAVRAGQADFGVLPARAWPAAGAAAFAALQAPFVLGDYDTAREAIAGPAGAALKDQLERAGVVPLGLVPTQLRRVLAVKPLATLDDFHGLRIRISDNATSAADLRALGARALEGVTTRGVLDGLTRARIDGVEAAPVAAVDNKYGRDARHITAFALFGAVDTLVASSSAWERLSPSRREAIRAAAEDTIGFSATLPERDAASLEQLCRDGIRVTTADPAQLQLLAEATEPVRAALRRNRATAQVMRLLEATDGTGPKALPTPTACSTGAGRVDQTSESAGPPDGVYVVRTTRDDHQQFGEYSAAWSVPAFTWTTQLRAGKWVRTVVPEFADQVGDADGAGTYEVHGDEVTFRYTHPAVDASPPETLRWSYYDGRLTLEVVDVADLGAQIIYTAHPWRKVR